MTPCRNQTHPQFESTGFNGRPFTAPRNTEEDDDMDRLVAVLQDFERFAQFPR